MKLLVLWISVSLLVLGGCASSKENVFGNDLPTMKAMHDKKFGSQKTLGTSAVKKRPISHRDGDLAGSAKQRYHALASTFPQLPNPVLVTYVFPHLTPAGTPIPGYVTYFKLYHSDQIALPGEMSEKTVSEHQQ